MASDQIPARQSWAAAADANPGEVASVPTPLLRRADPVAFVGGKLAAALIAPLKAASFTVVAAEQRHPMLADLPPEANEYEAFGNGYGEIHSARAFRQLVERAMRTFSPKEDRWQDEGRVVDPFRPELRYAALNDREFDVLQERHLNVVRTAFRRAKTLVVALSASEVWEAQEDGTVFPGCAIAGNPRFDAERHATRTLTIEETMADLDIAVSALRGMNAGLEVVLMVSPEPQPATALPVHVLAAATVGKAVLRIAMEAAAQAEGVHYFPALEIASRRIGLGGYPADGAIPAEVVSTVADALLAISEGGAVAFDGSAPPIVATPVPSVGAAAPTGDAVAEPAEGRAKEPVAVKKPGGGKPKPAAKPKAVSAEPVDAYSALRAAQEKEKRERRARKSTPASAPEDQSGADREGKPEERKEARAGGLDEKRAARTEVKLAREAKRAANHDEKRAALADVKTAREAKRAARTTGVDGGAKAQDVEAASAASKRRPRGSAPTPAESAGTSPPPSQPKRGKRRGMGGTAPAALPAASAPPTDAASADAAPPRGARRQAKLAARAAVRAKSETEVAAPDAAADAGSAVPAAPRRGKRHRAKAGADVAAAPVPPSAEAAAPTRGTGRRAKLAAQSAAGAGRKEAGSEPQGVSVKRPGRARKAKASGAAGGSASTAEAGPAVPRASPRGADDEST